MFKFPKLTKTRSHLSLLSMAIAVAGSLTTPKASYGAGFGNAGFQLHEEAGQWKGLSTGVFQTPTENVAMQISTLTADFVAHATLYNLLLENARNAENAEESVHAINAFMSELKVKGLPKILRRVIAPAQASPELVVPAEASPRFMIPAQRRCNSHTIQGGGYHHVDAVNWALSTARNTRNTTGVNAASVTTWVEPKMSNAVLLIPILGWFEKATKTYVASCNYSHVDNYFCGECTVIAPARMSPETPATPVAITVPAQIIERDLTDIVDNLTILKDELNVYISQQELLEIAAAKRPNETMIAEISIQDDTEESYVYEQDEVNDIY